MLTSVLVGGALVVCGAGITYNMLSNNKDATVAGFGGKMLGTAFFRKLN